MWHPKDDEDIECVSCEIENLTELLDLMYASFENMGEKQLFVLFGLALNLSSNIFLWIKEEERRRENKPD